MQLPGHHLTWQTLGAVPSTLLIPLAARARGASLFPQLDPHDVCANEVLEALHTNVQTYLNDWMTVLNVLWRTQAIKRMGLNFFARHPSSQGVNLGAGLSNYFQWFDNGRNRWLDADLPEVMTLRQLIFHVLPPHCRHQTLNIARPGWWRRLKLPRGKRGQPVLLICEGVLMYLKPTQVHAVLQEISDNAPPGSEFVFDFISPVGIGTACLHPSVKDTGAEFMWGMRHVPQFLQTFPGLEMLEQRSVSEAYGMACCLTELLTAPFTGGPLYGLIRLGTAPA